MHKPSYDCPGLVPGEDVVILGSSVVSGAGLVCSIPAALK